MSRIDTAWFREQVEKKKLSQRRLAKLMGLDPAAVSYMFRGRRKMQLEDAAFLATLFSCSLDTIAQRAGVNWKAPPATGKIIQVTGTIGSRGQVTRKKLNIVVPAPDPSFSGYAYQIRAPKGPLSWFDRWIVFCSQETSVADHRLAIGRLNHKSLFGCVKPGYEPGTYRLVSLETPDEELTAREIHPAVMLRLV